VLREAPQPMTTRALIGRVMGVKAIAATDERGCALVQKTVLEAFGRAKGTIQRVEGAGVAGWRIGWAACARCQQPQKSTGGPLRVARPTTPCACSPLLTRRRSSRHAASCA